MNAVICNIGIICKLKIPFESRVAIAVDVTIHIHKWMREKEEWGKKE